MTTPLIIRHLEKHKRLTPECGKKWRNFEVLTRQEDRVNCKACLALLKERKLP